MFVTRYSRLFALALLPLALLAVCTGCAHHWVVRQLPESSGSFRDVAIGDFNADGLTDICGGGDGISGIIVWLGQPEGEWLLTSGPIETGMVRRLEVRDINADGFGDIISCGSGDLEGIRVWLNGGDGAWLDMGVLPGSGNCQSFHLADLNLDGNLDIVSANLLKDSSKGVNIWYGDGRGGWTRPSGPELPKGPFKDVAVADINDDGYDDIVAVGWKPAGGIVAWHGNGAGAWAYCTGPINKGNFHSVAVADLNGDGYPDIAAGSASKGITIWYRNKQCNWDEPVTLIDEGSFWDISAADVNGDGKPEIIASSFDTGGLSVWRLGTFGKWKRQEIAPGSSQKYYGSTLADLNGDGKGEIIAANTTEGIHVWSLERGKGKYLSPEEATVLTQSRATGGALVRGRARSLDAHLPDMLDRKRAAAAVTYNSAFKQLKGRGAEYRVGPYDILDVTLFIGLDTRLFQVPVLPDGTIFINVVSNKPIHVDGKTPSEITETIVEEMKKVVRFPHAVIQVKKFNSKKVTLLGAIRHTGEKDTGQGVFPLTGMETILDFVTSHGGPDKSADLQRIVVRRASGERLAVDLSQFFGPTVATAAVMETENIILDAGDRIMVPTTEALPKLQIAVLGQVKRPGLLELENPPSIMEAIARSGDFDKAASKKILLARGDERIQVDMKRILKGHPEDNLLLEHGDIVYVPKRFFAKWNRVIGDISPTVDLLQDMFLLRVQLIEAFDANFWKGERGVRSSDKAVGFTKSVGSD